MNSWYEKMRAFAKQESFMALKNPQYEKNACVGAYIDEENKEPYIKPDKFYACHEYWLSNP